jgi:drug/metabolite transporter (DMT)-like permease
MPRLLLIGALATTIWLLTTGTELVWSPLGYVLAVTHGIAVAVMCILLYMGIARGPIAVVVPIVAAHPALVLVVNVLMGVRPSAAQWAAMAVIIAGGIFIARTAVAEPEAAEAESNRVTVLIAIGACLAYVAIVLTSQVGDAADRVTDHVGRPLDRARLHRRRASRAAGAAPHPCRVAALCRPSG